MTGKPFRDSSLNQRIVPPAQRLISRSARLIALLTIGAASLMLLPAGSSRAGGHFTAKTRFDSPPPIFDVSIPGIKRFSAEGMRHLRRAGEPASALRSAGRSAGS